jgi:alkylation response protein AidB-like acyl-CoA dehydrogenase
VYGTDEQQRRYLPEMAKGDLIGTACITEAQSGSDIRNIATTATVSDTDPNTYVLNGKKMWVTNGLNANVFLVYCKTKERYASDDYDDRFSFFLVDRDTPGVSISPTISTLGLRGLGLTHVEFKDVKVNAVHHLIGQLGEGMNVLRNLHGYVRTALSGMRIA